MAPLFKRNKMALVIFTAPLLVLYILLVIFPLAQGFALSFTEWDGLNTPVFNGISNYVKMFKSRDLGVSLKNTVIYSSAITISNIVMGLLIAFLLSNALVRGVRFFKNVLFLPVVLSVSVVAQLWVAVYHGDFGLINQIAKALGSDFSQVWLSQPTKGILAIILAEAWKNMGYHMVIFYAAMRNVPNVYYEASRIDGASDWDQFRTITLPLISETLKVDFVINITYGFKAFDMIYAMTGGGPSNYNYTLPIMMYKALFGLQKYGYANAISMVIVVSCVVIMVTVDKVYAKVGLEQ